MTSTDTDLDRAVRHLEQTGMTVLDRTWECADGSLDLVATESRSGGRVIYAYRVRTLPATLVSRLDVRRSRRVALRWMVAHGRTFGELRTGTITLGALTIGRSEDQS